MNTMDHNSRHELTDHQWKLIDPLLPKGKKRGRPMADPRKTLNGILFVLKTGCAWADMPKAYGSHVTCWRRLRQWQKDGTWERIWRKLLQQCDEQQKINWEYCFLDGTFVPAKKGRCRWKNQGRKGNKGNDGNRWERTSPLHPHRQCTTS